MGSSGYMTCGVCHTCGNCYPRRQTCAACGAQLDLDGEACVVCGVPITQAMRDDARERFKRERYREFLEISGLTQNYAPKPPALPKVW